MNIDSNVMAFMPEFSQVAEYKAEECALVELDEGIDVSYARGKDEYNRVFHNSSHNRGIDSTLAHNPVVKHIEVPTLDINSDDMKIYSILKRTNAAPNNVGKDGNPLLYALKKEKGYQFASKRDRKYIKHDIKLILDKFVKQYFAAIQNDIATVIVPSGNNLNAMFADWFEDAVKRNGYKMKVYDDILEKVTTETVLNDVIDDGRSDFTRWLGSLPEKKATLMKKTLLLCLDNMDKTHNGAFSYHLVTNSEIRNHLSLSMKLSKTPSIAHECKFINDCNVILLDDSISRGTSLKEAYSLLVQCYHPTNITGLTLFSSLNCCSSK